VGLKLGSVPEKSSTMKPSRLAMISIAVLLLTGCAELPSDAPVTPVDYKACVVEQKAESLSPLAELADYGVKQAVVTYGIGRSVFTVTDSQFRATVQKQLKQKCSLFVVSGVGFENQLVEVAKMNPSANFVYISDQSSSALVFANLENLVVFSADTFEAGLITGFLAAGLTDNGRVLTGVCPVPSFIEPFKAGYDDGIVKYSSLSGNPVENIRYFDTLPANGPFQPDVALIGGCPKSETTYVLNNTEAKWVGYGRDLYTDSSMSKLKTRLAANIEPQIGAKVLELIGADLEGDFIGGTFGSFHATYGNGGLQLSPEHDINIPPALIELLKTAALDYETSLKK